MEKQSKHKYVNKETIGLAQAAKLHGCSQWEELKNRRLRTKRLQQWWQNQNAETLRIIATGQRIPGPGYIITGKLKKQDQK